MAIEMSGPFGAAKDHVNSVREEVLDRQAVAIADARVFREIAETNILAMGDFEPKLLTTDPPKAPDVKVQINGRFNLPELPIDSFGMVDAPNLGAAPVVSFSPVPSLSIAPYVDRSSAIQIPTAPEDRTFGPGPAAPSFGPIVLPDAPVLNRPNLPALEQITIPTFVPTVLPVFDATAPEFAGSYVSTVLQWTEVPFEPTIMAEAMDKLRLMWAGGTGLPPAVEQALWERAASREDIAINRDVSAAATEFAGRGFTMPPGMLANRIDAIRTEGQIRKLGLGREVLVKVADTQIENLRFACTQAVASEQVLVSIWSGIAARSFDAAKVQLDSQLALLNAQIAIFNAKQSAYATEATVFKARLEAKLAEIQVYKAQIDGEVAKGSLNEQRTRVYSEMVKALMADIEVYKSQMQGVQAETDIQKNQVEMYKVSVQAFAETIQADKTRFDAYESRVRGELAKAQVVDASARGYAAYISGQSAAANINIENNKAQLAQADLSLRAYIAGLELSKTTIQAQSEAVKANADAHRANTSRYAAQAGAETAKVQLEISATEAATRVAVALYDTEIRKFQADAAQMIQIANIQLEALKSVAQANSTLAAGSMAGINISSSISGAGSMSASGSYSESVTLTPGSVT